MWSIRKFFSTEEFYPLQFYDYIKFFQVIFLLCNSLIMNYILFDSILPSLLENYASIVKTFRTENIAILYTNQVSPHNCVTQFRIR